MLRDVITSGNNLSEYTPFKSFGSVLGFRNGGNPARLKRSNALEIEKNYNEALMAFIEKSEFYSFGGSSQLFSEILKEIEKTLSLHSPTRVKAWRLANEGDRAGQYAPEDIAEAFGKSHKTIYRWLRAINEDLRFRFIQRGWIPAPDKKQQPEG